MKVNSTKNLRATQAQLRRSSPSAVSLGRNSLYQLRWHTLAIALGVKAMARVGWADRLPINQFSGKLRSAFHGQVQTIRPRDGGTRKRIFSGLRLRKTDGPHERSQERVVRMGTAWSACISSASLYISYNKDKIFMRTMRTMRTKRNKRGKD